MKTSDISLRNFQESDALDLYQMCLDENLIKSGVHSYSSLAESEATVREWSKDANCQVITDSKKRFIGFIMLEDMNRYSGYTELEYAIAKQYRNNGYTTAAINCMLTHGFDKLGVSVIAAWVRSHNLGSIRVLEKCGFTFEGRLRKHARDKSDTLCYSMLKEEWHQDDITFSV